MTSQTIEYKILTKTKKAEGCAEINAKPIAFNGGSTYSGILIKTGRYGPPKYVFQDGSNCPGITP